MSVPAGIMQALQGAGGPGPGPGPSGPPPSITIPGSQDSGPQGGKSDGDWEEDLQAALDALRDLEKDATDHQEASVIATCIANLRKLTAQRQSGAESALGVTPAHKAMARAGY